jgi:hypothetical protein
MDRRTMLKFAAALGAAGSTLDLNANVKKDSGAKVKSGKRLLIVHTGGGFYSSLWEPRNNDLAKSPLIGILKDHHGDLTYLKDIHQPGVLNGHSNNITIYTCGRRQPNGGPFISIDQFIADRLEQTTRFKSFNMGGQRLSWSKSSRQVPSYMKTDPKKVYGELFGSGDAKTSEAKQRSLRELKKLYRSSSDLYRNALAELEREIAVDYEWGKVKVPKIDIPLTLNFSDNHARGYRSPVGIQFDLALNAFKRDRAQVVLLSPAYIDKTTTIGVKGSYHAIGHEVTSKVAGRLKDMEKIERYVLEEFNVFLAKLKAEKLFDDTIVLFQGGFCDPGGHSRRYLPTLLMGGGLKPQGIVECRRGDQNVHTLSSVFLTIMHQMGIDAPSFSGFDNHMDKVLIG